MQKKKIVILGGGNGGSISIRAMKNYADFYDLSAVIAMSDSGGSSGELRREFGVLPPGDILRAILAMSRYDYDMIKHIFYDSRYSKHGKLKGFGLGHLFLAFVEKYDGSIINAIRPLAQALDVVGPVFPVTLQSVDLVAHLQDGTTVVGEHEIDRPNWSGDNRIVSCSLDPKPQGYERALEEIEQADFIIIGPGSFYTSIVATLLPVGVQDAIARSKAKLLFVPGNAVEIAGEYGPCTLSEFVSTLESYLPRELDVVLYKHILLSDIQQEYYIQKGWKQFTGDVSLVKCPIIGAEYEKVDGGLDPKRLGSIVHDYICSVV